MNSQLRNAAGAMCCLGFFARSCNIPTDDILDRGSPEETLGLSASKASKGLPIFNKLLLIDNNYESDWYGGNSLLTRKLMEVNDMPNIPIKIRINEIKKLFRQNGVLVTFKP
jgi:hypothetical protein